MESSYHRVGMNRGQKRVWLQNRRLEHFGFSKGTRYTRMVDAATGTIILIASERGEKLVSGRRQRSGSDQYTPIIDICFAELVEVFGEEGDRVRVDYRMGQISISLHHFCQKVRDRVERLRRHLREGYLTEGTLCAGIGMATLALQQGFAAHGLKMRTEWIVDRERKYLEVACANNDAHGPETQVFEASLEELEPHLLGPVDVMQVSLPCTGQSQAGKSKNKLEYAEAHPTDATAIYGLLKVLEPVNPAIICSENVKGAQNSATYELLRGILRQLNYDVAEVILTNEQSGALEQRERYWLVAVDCSLAAPDLLESIPRYPARYRKLGEALEPLSHDDPAWSDHQYLKDKAERDRLAGKGFANRNLVTPESPGVNTIGRHYHKRRSTEPMLVRGDGMERLLTPAEHARVKGASPELVHDIPATTAHEGLGQGIDMGQGRGLAEAIARTVLAPLLAQTSSPPLSARLEAMAAPAPTPPQMPMTIRNQAPAQARLL